MNWEQNLTLSAVHNVQNLSSEWRTLIIHNLIGVAQLVIKGEQLKFFFCYPCIIEKIYSLCLVIQSSQPTANASGLPRQTQIVLVMSELQIPLWLSIGLAIFVGLVAVWQVPRIQVRLSGDYSTERAKPEGVSGFKHWGKLLAGLVLFLVIGVFGEAWLWTQQTYEMAGIKYDFGEDAKGDRLSLPV